ncbi:MAG: putative ABC transporter ATP-binding protein [Candidatus Heimdallarchaeota archaeon LC_3]|nr:MAG: putative ABC transporter ATP-binding protein [Candidatus Heimdallarchaeota archaeon LC_3]
MAWHLSGSLSKEDYDRQYTDKELLLRLKPYLFNYKNYLLLVIFFSVIATIFSLIIPLLFAIGFDELISVSKNREIILLMSVSYLILLVLEWIGQYYSNITNRKIQALIAYDLRKEMFEKVNSHDLSFFDTNKTGKIMSRISGDSFEVAGVILIITDLIAIVLRAIIILLTLFLLNWILASLTLIVFPILFGLVFTLRRIVRRNALLQRRANATLNSFVEESINGMVITKTFSQEPAVLQNFKEFENQKVRVNLRQNIIMMTFSPILDFLTAISLFIVLLGGGVSVMDGVLTFGFLYLFITYLRRLFGPLIEISTFYATLQNGFAAAERIFSMMDVPNHMKSGNIPCPELNGSIRFENVTFKYNNREEYLFKNFNLNIAAGQKLAVVGETGSGKTSFAGLLSRMYEFESGKILLDNVHNLQELEPDSLRSHLGYVIQEPFLFSGTILDNLLLGSPSASEDQVIDALNIVGAHFVHRLPEGIHTLIMERGRSLSQGQKQLLALARILIKNPKILILDEATASVDAYTEKMIQDALAVVMKNRTTIVIAHRLSTVINADRIIVLNDGKIVEDGKHDELILKSGKYRELYENYYEFQGALS